MDVTFFENARFYPNSSLQREISNVEPINWDLITPSIPYLEPPAVLHTEPEPSSDLVTREPPAFSDIRLNHIRCTLDENIINRAYKVQYKLGLENNAPVMENHLDDKTIALRKRVRSCTQHPIGNFLSLERFSMTYYAFLSNLDLVLVPSTIDEAFNDPKWKVAVFDEIKGT